MQNGKYDVVPSTENAGLVVRANPNELARIATVSEKRRATEVAAFEKNTAKANADATAKHLAKVASYNDRDLLAATATGLPVVGPSSPDSQTVTALAHNQAVVILESRIAALEA